MKVCEECNLELSTRGNIKITSYSIEFKKNLCVGCNDRLIKIKRNLVSVKMVNKFLNLYTKSTKRIKAYDLFAHYETYSITNNCINILKITDFNTIVAQQYKTGDNKSYIRNQNLTFYCEKKKFEKEFTFESIMREKGVKL